ncbi:MAG: glycosyltransferase family 4 protein [Tissierellia bacterium]|nr:glycosyltransferase family 4 protein [Tissierellia bacterium]
MKIVRLTPGMDNVNFIKDPGMIPYILFKYFGYEGGVASYWEEGFTYLDKEVKGLEFYSFKKVTGKPTLDAIIFLINNAKKIDVLIVYFMARQSFLWILTYKILNRRGKVYLKGDACEKNLPEFFRKEFKYSVIKKCMTKIMIKMSALTSIETKKLQNFINKEHGIQIEYIPNGFYDYGIRKDIDYKYKNNTICTVGRIGTSQKASEILLEAFALASDKIIDWQLKMIGSIEDDFKQYIDEYFSRYPELKDKVIFTGPIYDREKLDDEYAKSKIFCLPSRWESFGLVYLEALKNGCYIITTDIPPANDVTDNQKYGKIFPIDDYKKLSEIIIELVNNEHIIEKAHKEAQNFVYNNFYWVNICR